MAIDLRVAMRRAAATMAALAVSAGVAHTADQPPPDVKRVCVPAADGRTWNCGTIDDPPEAHELPPPEARPSTAEPPPFFLAHPDGPVVQSAAVPEAPPPEPPRTDDFPEVERVTPGGESASTAEVTPVDDAGAATVEATSDAAAEPVASASDDSAATIESTDDATATADTSDAAPSPDASAIGDAPVSDPVEPAAPVTEAPSPTETAPVEPVAAEPPAPIDAPVADASASTPVAEPAPLDVGRTTLGRDAFLALDATRQTIQLARAPSPDGFASLAWSLGLAPESTFAVPFALDGGTTWLLLWSDFPDVAAARTALDALVREHRVGGVYVRRIGPLQRDLRAHPR